VFLIVDTEHRRIVEDWFETREEAEARRAELVEAEPEAEGILVVMGTLDQPD
jgi:hypothetical protein